MYKNLHSNHKWLFMAISSGFNKNRSEDEITYDKMKYQRKFLWQRNMVILKGKSQHDCYHQSKEK